METIKRVLLVDDDTSANTINSILLKRVSNRPEVLVYTDPEKALLYLQSAFPKAPVKTLILLDINMPIISGWEFLEILAAFPGEIRDYFVVWMLSSSIDPPDVAKAKTYSMVSRFVHKPLYRKDLESLLGE